MIRTHTNHPYFETFAQRDARVFRETVASASGKPLGRRRGRRALPNGTIETYELEG